MASIEHYLPQFLLRGFAARVDRGRHHVYVFRRGSTPRLANVRTVAGERGFYGAVNAVAVEPALAAKETVYGELVKHLRTSGATGGDKPLIDAFVLHVLGRGQHLRESSVETVNTAIETTAAGLRARKNQEALLLSALERSPGLMAGVPRAKRGAARKQLEQFARQQVRRGAIDPLLAAELAHIRKTLDVNEAARRGQGDAVLREPSESQARPALAALSWDVRRSQAHTYILSAMWESSRARRGRASQTP